MIYSVEHNLAVFCVPKVASKSLVAAFESVGFCYPYPYENHEWWGRSEWTTRDVVTRWVERLPFLAGMRKASFVRHPADRLVSGYRFVTAPGNGGYVEPMPSFREIVRDLVAGRIQDEGVFWHIGVRQSDLLVNHETGDLVVDFLGRFEQLRFDFESLCSLAGLTPPQLSHLNASGPPVDWRDWYDAETLAAVRTYFADDFRRFGYG